MTYSKVNHCHHDIMAFKFIALSIKKLGITIIKTASYPSIKKSWSPMIFMCTYQFAHKWTFRLFYGKMAMQFVIKMIDHMKKIFYLSLNRAVAGCSFRRFYILPNLVKIYFAYRTFGNWINIVGLFCDLKNGKNEFSIDLKLIVIDVCKRNQRS